MRAAVLGTISALPLLVGAWLALKSHPSGRTVGLVAAFGAGALLSAVSFELVLDATGQASPGLLAFALALGAVVYYAGDGFLDSRAQSGGSSARGLALLLGATLDGIPESFILGISIAAGGGLSLAFLVAVMVSNLPEGMASASELGGTSEYPDRRILQMWTFVVAVSSVFAALGATVGARGTVTGAAAQAFAAGALLTMLIDDLIPEARERGGLGAGLAAVLGFAVAFGLHQLGA